MTLNRCYTGTEVTYSELDRNNGPEISFLLDGIRNEVFEAKIKKYLENIVSLLPILQRLSLDIRTTNSFPHSAGIASSASGMSAFALCLASINEKSRALNNEPEAFFREASNLARLGSGSASRSVYGGYALWGETPSVQGSSNEFAIPLEKDIHPRFNDLHDAILIVSSEEKRISSRAGHDLMNSNPFSEQRFGQARKNLENIIGAMKSGDMESFIDIIEEEALSLHAMMFTSSPSFILLQPSTLKILDIVRDYRKQTGNALGFTMDAGPNVHLIYPADIREEVKELIDTELAPCCQDGRWIDDKMGEGPKPIENCNER